MCGFHVSNHPRHTTHACWSTPAPLLLHRWLLPSDDSKGHADLVSGLLIKEGSPLHGKSARQAGFGVGTPAKLTAVSRGGRVQDCANLLDFVLKSGDVVYVTGEQLMHGTGTALFCKLLPWVALSCKHPALGQGWVVCTNAMQWD